MKLRVHSQSRFRRFVLCTLALLAAMLLTATLAGNPLLRESFAANALDGLESDPAALARFLANSPDKLAVVLISTPGCPFCKLVRERELQPLLRNAPQFKGQVGLFEILLRDPTRFEPPIAELTTRQHGVLSNVGSPAELSDAMKLNLAPVVLFFGKGTELGEPMIGYSEHFYGSYLEENIRQALAQLRP